MNRAKRWLSRGRRIEQEIAALETAKRETFERLTSAVGATDGIHAAGTKDPHVLDAFADFDLRISQRTAELIRIRTELVSVIERVPDQRYRELLLHRYVSGMTWEAVAVEMHYSFYHVVSELHPEALAAIDPFIEDPI